MPASSSEESRANQVAKAFFQATTKLSDDNEDILPQEDGVDQRLSVFCLFSELFPEFANDKDRPDTAGKHGLMRLQFNKIGYEMYDKEQSRRVPAVRAKPGNPGYGFRRARWRETLGPGEDRRICETILRSLGVSNERLERIRKRVHDFKLEWDAVRRPSRPAGPGRPRGHKRAPGDAIIGSDAVPAVPCGQQPSTPKKSKKCTTTMMRNGKPLDQMMPFPVCGPGSATTSASVSGGTSPDVMFPDPLPVPALVVDGVPWGLEPAHLDGDEKTRSLGEENSSLRALNMSLIYEREQILGQIRHSDAEITTLQSQFDKLLDQASQTAENGHLVAGFKELNVRLSAKTPAEQASEISEHNRVILEKAVDTYEEYQRSVMSNKLVRVSRNRCIGLMDRDQEDQGFEELRMNAQDLRCRSCDDLKEILRFSSSAPKAAPSMMAGNALQQSNSQTWTHDVRQVQQDQQQQQQQNSQTKEEHQEHIHNAFVGFDGLEDSCNDFNSCEYLFSTAAAF